MKDEKGDANMTVMCCILFPYGDLFLHMKQQQFSYNTGVLVSPYTSVHLTVSPIITTLCSMFIPSYYHFVLV